MYPNHKGTTSLKRDSVYANGVRRPCTCVKGARGPLAVALAALASQQSDRNTVLESSKEQD